MNNNAAQPTRGRTGLTVSSPKRATLLDESRALSYALVMVLAHTPRQELSSEEIDALCQLAYELLNKITKTHDIFQETRQKLHVGALSRTVDEVRRSCE